MENIYVPLILVVLFCALGCVLGETNEEGEAESQPWRDLATGANSNIEQAKQEVFQSEDVWHDWWKRHNTSYEYIDGKMVATKPPEVHFSKETILVVTLGMRSTGGYSVVFTRVHYDGETLVAHLRYTAPGPDDMVTMALTAPFAIIAVPKHEGPVRFVDDK